MLAVALCLLVRTFNLIATFSFTSKHLKAANAQFETSWKFCTSFRNFGTACPKNCSNFDFSRANAYFIISRNFAKRTHAKESLFARVVNKRNIRLTRATNARVKEISRFYCYFCQKIHVIMYFIAMTRIPYCKISQSPNSFMPDFQSAVVFIVRIHYRTPFPFLTVNGSMVCLLVMFYIRIDYYLPKDLPSFSTLSMQRLYALKYFRGKRLRERWAWVIQKIGRRWTNSNILDICLLVIYQF